MPRGKHREDVRVWRDEQGILRANVRHLAHHSPAGFECGYGGSGPADLALAILAAFVPPREPSDRERLWDGQHCSRFAWTYHQAFKWQFISSMPKEGGTIPADAIEAWIAARQSEAASECTEVQVR